MLYELNYLHYITIYYITLQYITLNYNIIITLQYITLNYNLLHYITIYYITQPTCFHLTVEEDTVQAASELLREGSRQSKHDEQV